jgi:predicted nucleotidyltransferase
MTDEKILSTLAREICRKHRCHTVIVYGSRARGDATPSSDYDVLGIRAKGEMTRDTRRWKGAYLDVFVYPERKLRRAGADFLRVRGGRVLVEKDRFGTRLLARLDKIHARGPKALKPDERQALKVWMRKMLDRIRARDEEANFRRVFLLTLLLEDYFLLRNRWYEGPKASFAWLRQNRPDVYGRFQRALKPNAPIAAIEALIEVVV